jgi:antitoxin FitA
MATIQVRDLPDDVADTFRRRARASGQSLQAYMRDEMIKWAHQRDKTELMAIVEGTLNRDPGPGARRETILETLRELRGE